MDKEGRARRALVSLLYLALDISLARNLTRDRIDVQSSDTSFITLLKSSFRSVSR